MTYVGYMFMLGSAVLLICALLRPSASSRVRFAASLCLMLFAIVFLCADIAAGAKGLRPPWTTWLTVPMLDLLQADGATLRAHEYKSAVSTVLGTILAIVTIWFAVVLPYRSVSALKEELHQSEIVQIKPIHEEGVDDLRTLTELLEHAHKAVMFAGSYEWIVKPDKPSEKSLEATRKLRGVLDKMIDKERITFVSNFASARDVRQKLEEHDSDFATKFMKVFKDKSGRKKKIMLTLIWRDEPERAFCSRVGKVPLRSSTEKNNIVVESATPGGAVLIQIIENLIEPEIFNKAGNES